MGTGCSECIRRESDTVHKAPRPPAAAAKPASPSMHKAASLASIGGRNLLANNSGQHPREGYHIEKQPVGSGGYGVVRRVRSRKTNHECALKMMNKEKVNEDLLRNEVEVLLSLDHPHIVKLFDVYEDRHFVYMVMEVCNGGEVLDKILDRQRFSEVEAFQLCGQLLYAVNYMHGKCIAHRDIKLENMLFRDKDADIGQNPLKLIDFGFAKEFKVGQSSFRTLAGSAYYVAPEVLNADYTPYNEKCDLWSTGVVLHMLLSGVPPFKGRTEEAILQRIRSSELKFPDAEWKDVSEEAKQMIRRLIERDVRARASGAEALAECRRVQASYRAAEMCDTSSERPRGYFQRLQQFSSVTRFQQVARHLIARHLDDHTIQELQATFQALDQDGDGMLSLQEAKEGLAKGGLEENEVLQRIFRQIDTDGSDKIDYTEFLAATMDQRHFFKEELVWEAFRVFDRDGDGRITREELEATLADSTGSLKLSAGEILEMLSEVDSNGDGSVDFGEFLAMMSRCGSPRTPSSTMSVKKSAVSSARGTPNAARCGRIGRVRELLQESAAEE